MEDKIKVSLTSINMDKITNIDPVDASIFAGILWAQNNSKNFINNPLSSLFNGLIYGGLCGISAGFIKNKINKTYHPLISGLIIISGGVWFYKRWKNPLPDNRILIRYNN